MKFKLKFKKKLNNRGSSIVMVVASIGFIGIIIGALLSAASYAYKLKMQDLNAKDNFYYVEQALNEIYAGVGSKTVESMQAAYIDTVENMVYYDVDPLTPQEGYTTMSQEEANKNFRQKFLQKISSNDFFSNLSYNAADPSDPNAGKKKIAVELEKLITNESVELDSKTLYVETVHNADGTIKEIVIRNLTLNRTQDYNRNSANGSFTQTITTDIVIGEPNFNVSFTAIATSYANIYNYAMVADSGIQINQNTALSIVGNVYGASDYYNKRYNEAASVITYDKTYSTKNLGATVTENVALSYAMNPVKNPSASIGAADGEDQASRYSGLYVGDGGNVSILADTVIVPGSVSVMDSASLLIYGKEGLAITNSQLWTDNIVLGGETLSGARAASATIYADAYVSDDTELNGEGSSLSFKGAYYGYGNSTRANNRWYTNRVDLAHFKEDSNKDGNYTNEDDDDLGHYNSSAIIINGKESTLDISQADTLYLAGRTYIELSRHAETTTAGGATTTQIVYDPTIRDYKTGESLSIKSNQLAYIPVAIDSTINDVKADPDDEDSEVLYRTIELSPSVVGTPLYQVFFPAEVFVGNQVPVISQSVGAKQAYFYDFETAYTLIKNKYDASPSFKAAYDAVLSTYYSGTSTASIFSSADDFAAEYIAAYSSEVGVTIDTFAADLAQSAATNIYASGAITSKAGTAFNLTTQRDFDAFKQLLNITDTTYTVFDMTNDYANEYEYVKWNLGHFKSSDLEQYDGSGIATGKKVEEKYIDEFIAEKGSGWLTPINKFMNFNEFSNMPTGVTAVNLILPSGYVAFASKEDIVVGAANPSGEVKGIIVSMGNISFDSTVKTFEGLIVAGGKIYVNNGMVNMTSNSELCRTVLKELLLTGTEDAKFILKLFKDYENASASIDSNADADGYVTIDTIDYTDVVEYINWMKNVE